MSTYVIASNTFDPLGYAYVYKKEDPELKVLYYGIRSDCELYANARSQFEEEITAALAEAKIKHAEAKESRNE